MSQLDQIFNPVERITATIKCSMKLTPDRSAYFANLAEPLGHLCAAFSENWLGQPAELSLARGGTSDQFLHGIVFSATWNDVIDQNGNTVNDKCYNMTTFELAIVSWSLYGHLRSPDLADSETIPCGHFTFSAIFRVPKPNMRPIALVELISIYLSLFMAPISEKDQACPEAFWPSVWCRLLTI